MMRVVSWLLGVLLLLVGSTAGNDKPAPVAVEAEGVAEWKKPYEQATRQAIRDALQQAIEQACGVRLARMEIGRDGMLEQSAQLAFEQGVVLNWQMLCAPRQQNGCVYVRVRAEVMPLSALQTPADWREVWQTVGHPPLRWTLRYTGELEMEPSARQTIQSLARQLLAEMGVRLSTQPDKSQWQLIAELEVSPITRWGDANAPYALGDQFASWQARLQLMALAPDRKEPVLLAQRTARAVSLVSDTDAVHRAIRHALTQPDANWRITLATLWVEHLLSRPEEGFKSHSVELKPAKKEVQRNANERNANRGGASAPRNTARTRANRH